MLPARRALESPHGDGAQALKLEARFGAAFLRRYGLRLLLVFVGLLLPLWAFAELADEIHEQEAIPFDVPILQFAHSLAREGFDSFFVPISQLGYLYGVVPFDIGFTLVLVYLRRFREATYAAVALGGSALLNLAAKQGFARDRPSLWESIAPEHNYSFPSGHAMGSATLACVLTLLAWRTCWRWPVAVAMAAFVTLVGLSRVYLGVHYPSDILAGWSVATAWAVAVYLIAFRGGVGPWLEVGRRP
ncbi:phosphatase PAP2 family protein [Lysobacter sp. Root667]|uniref:phosphatase PAP2 family protein n=1 Tax=Lysobacter sp. Root667 TaxID=1736581 RepID=UPI0009E94025|nr:phosphatase PAP2 family protein [Lysobacter sp. Root667]